jgi:LmbE family N-acetylglucosaminyl deacetylase
MSNVLIVAAHPDDELLGVGGTAARHALAGDAVTAVVACESESLRYGCDVGQRGSLERAAKVLGVGEVVSLDFPDQRLDTVSLTELIAPLEALSERLRPNIVYCQYGGDINRDHHLLFEAANVAFRPLEPWIEAVYSFYTASSTEWAYPRTFQPDTWTDISDTLEKKLEAFACYTNEIRTYPHPRSPEALRHAAHFWGNQCCMEAAEVFMTVRRVNRREKRST